MQVKQNYATTVGHMITASVTVWLSLQTTGMDGLEDNTGTMHCSIVKNLASIKNWNGIHVHILYHLL